MMDFIYKLYDYDNFTLYLTIILVVLIILFVLVLIFGKKDKALEETRRLQKIELEDKTAFKEEKKEKEKAEAKSDKISLFDIMEKEENSKEPKEVHMTIFEPRNKTEQEQDLPVINEPLDDEELPLPTLNEDENEFSFADLDEINLSLEKDLQNLKSIKDEFSNIELPVIEKEKEESLPEKKEEQPKIFQPSGVFSSVFVGKEKESDTLEMPKVTIEENKIEKKPSEDDDDDFELPLLK